MQVKSLVQRALQSAPVTTIPVADRQPLPSTSMAVPGSIAAAAQRVMSHVFDACLQVRLILGHSKMTSILLCLLLHSWR